MTNKAYSSNCANAFLAGMALIALFAVWEFEQSYLLLPRFGWKGYEYYESWIAVFIFPICLALPPLLAYWWFRYRNYITRLNNYKVVVVSDKSQADFFDGKTGFPIPNVVKAHVYSRDQGRCQYCHCFTVPSFGFEKARHIGDYISALSKLVWLSATKNVFKPVRLFEADHIVPEVIGGDGRNPDAVCTACRNCNRKKGARIKPPFDFHIFKFLKENNLTIHQECL